MFFHLILTTECNLQCTYCYGGSLEDAEADFPFSRVDYYLPRRLGYDVSLLDEFCRQDPECALIFYGGEPTLCIDDIRQVMDNVKAKHFLIQTNGLFLDRLDSRYLSRVHTILISIDGDKTLTDYYRGTSTSKKVVDNLRSIRQNGFKGELIARMTVMEQTDIYKQVNWLLNNDEFPFSSVHWQLNAGFWNDFENRPFKDWCEESYNPGIFKLAKFWVNHMENRGQVLRLYPFLGIAQSLLSSEEQSFLRCGAGWINYAIQTDGYIIPCPSMWGIKDLYLGHISDTNPSKLKKIFPGEPCTKCPTFCTCGGRCLYANLTQRWNSEAYSLVCRTVRNLLQAVKEELPRIRRLIGQGTISPENFRFMMYNGCEIIP